MTKYELTHKVVSRTGLKKDVCEQIIDTFMDEIKIALMNGEKVNFTNLFTVEPYHSADRTIRNVHTHEIQTIPGSVRVRFKISKTLKAEMNEET